MKTIKEKFYEASARSKADELKIEHKVLRSLLEEALLSGNVTETASLKKRLDVVEAKLTKRIKK